MNKYRLAEAKSGDMRYKRAVVYSIRSGEFNVRTGWIIVGSKSNPRWYFTLENGDVISVYFTPGFVYNGFVWFYEEKRNDTAAIKILLDYEKDKIESLKRQLESHHDNCAVLIKALDGVG